MPNSDGAANVVICYILFCVPKMAPEKALKIR